MRVVYVQLREQDALAVIVHHLVMDGVSWRILLGDMETVYDQLKAGGPVHLPPKTSSFRQWARYLEEQASTPQLASHMAYWTQMLGDAPILLPVDFEGGANLERDATSVSVALEEQETGSILHTVVPALGGDIDALLLAALTRSLGDWCGTDEALIELEWHGRDALAAHLDTTRTIGWFTSLCPVRLSIRNAHRSIDKLASVLRQMKELRIHRASYPLLRYQSANPDLYARLAGHPRPEVSFNYLGRFDSVDPGHRGWRIAPADDALQRSPRNHRSCLIEVNGGVAGTRLTFDWHFSTGVHRIETISMLAGNFLDHVRTFAVAARELAPERSAQPNPVLVPTERRTLDRIAGRIGHT